MTHNKDQDKDLEPIVKNDGFRRIADAIRQSTVLAQYYRYRSESKEKLYDIRYGLGQDLIRKGKYKRDFVKALTEFIAKYTNENAMVEEQAAKRGEKIRERPKVQLSDLDEIVRLIDLYDGDSELICNLLVAYGYAADFPKNTQIKEKVTDNS